MRCTLTATALITFLASFPLGSSSLLAQTVGTTGAVNPASTGTPPGGNSRTLEIGSDVVFQERIQTTASGALQVLFVDRSALTVGPNSDITIDEFVYDPGTGTGTFVASLAKGSLRFIGGQISKNSGATFKSPAMTIGVRGTNFEMSYIPQGDGTAVAYAANYDNSQMTVTTQGSDGSSNTASVPQNGAIAVTTETSGGASTVDTGAAGAIGGGSEVVAGGTTTEGGTGTGSGTGGGDTPSGGTGTGNPTTDPGTDPTGETPPLPDIVTDVYEQETPPASPEEPPPDPEP